MRSERKYQQNTQMHFSQNNRLTTNEQKAQQQANNGVLKLICCVSTLIMALINIAGDIPSLVKVLQAMDKIVKKIIEIDNLIANTKDKVCCSWTISQTFSEDWNSNQCSLVQTLRGCDKKLILLQSYRDNTELMTIHIVFVVINGLIIICSLLVALCYCCNCFKKKK